MLLNIGCISSLEIIPSIMIEIKNQKAKCIINMAMNLGNLFLSIEEK